MSYGQTGTWFVSRDDGAKSIHADHPGNGARGGDVGVNAAELHEKSVIIDGVVGYLDGWTENIAQSGVTALVLELATHQTDFRAALRNIANALQVIRADPDHFVQARTAADIRRAKANGKIGCVFYIQNGRPLEDDLSRLNLFVEVGVRIFALTGNDRNFLADGCLEPSNAGLSNLGRRVVHALNERHILIDLSHTGERSSFEAMEQSSAPCVFSHNNPRRRVDNPRNITDEQMRRCADRGGVIGVCPIGYLSWTGGEKPPTIDDLVENIEYVAELVGVEHVAVSSDTDVGANIDEVMTRAGAANRAYPSTRTAFVERFGHSVESLEYRRPVPLSRFPLLTDRLVRRGWSEADVQMVLGGNWLRLWEHVWGA